MSLPLYTVFICFAILFINANGQCAGSTERCGCNNPTSTTPRTIEIVRVRDQERRREPVRETIDRRQPVVLQPTIQKYFVFPQNSRAVRYTDPYPVGHRGGYYMMPVAVRRKVIKKNSTDKPN